MTGFTKSALLIVLTLALDARVYSMDLVPKTVNVVVPTSADRGDSQLPIKTLKDLVSALPNETLLLSAEYRNGAYITYSRLGKSLIIFGLLTSGNDRMLSCSLDYSEGLDMETARAIPVIIMNERRGDNESRIAYYGLSVDVDSKDDSRLLVRAYFPKLEERSAQKTIDWQSPPVPKGLKNP